jgi:class 3 adenylate cyclase
MSLWAKLFLWIGSLLVFVALAMFILPRELIESDVSQAISHVSELVRLDQAEIKQNQQAWIENQISQIQTNVNAALFLINETKQDRQSLSLEKLSAESWEAIVHIIAYHPEIGLFQLNNPQQQNTIAVIPHNGSLHPVEVISSKDSSALIHLTTNVGENTKREALYVGIPLRSQGINETSLYILFEWEKKKNGELEGLEDIQQTFKSLAFQSAIKEFQEIFQRESFFSSSIWIEKEWINKMALMQVLAPLYAESLLFKKKPPIGIAGIDSQGKGVALLAKDIFRTEPLFDDETYYQKHQPTANAPSIALGKALIKDPHSDEIYLGNTLKLGSNYITIATSMDTVVRNLALASNYIVLCSSNQNNLQGYMPDGSEIAQNIIQLFGKEAKINRSKTVINFGKTYYYYNVIQPFNNASLEFYILIPQKSEKTIIATLGQLNKNLTQRISLQMFFVMVVSLLIAFLILLKITAGVTRPISKLALAANSVREGKFELVELPDVENRSDEIATLTQSFGEMIEGLQEREKIRAVLDKVVSKDIADEILKSSIQLGGEDRIVTMLFSDIRDFTKLTENFPPQKTIKMLNSFMTKMSRVIEGEGGIIDKYVGDEIMALYGAPTSHPDHAIRALSSAKLMIETLKKWNQERSIQNEPLIYVGIGIHTGLVVAGNMGAQDRLNYTVVGANVNLAARLCQVAKPMQIIISEGTLNQTNVKESFYVQPLEPIALKGFSELINIYEVVGFKWVE